MGANGNPPSRLGDVHAWTYEPDASNVTNRGWLSEALIVGSYATVGDGTVTPFSPTLQFLDSKTLALPSRVKSLLIVVTTVFVVAGQASVRLASSRKAAAQAVGAASSYPDKGGLMGPSTNFGPAANLPAGVYWITPSTVGGSTPAATGLPDLQWAGEYMGVEINFGAAPASGALYVAFVTYPV
jgi:hypothetical protein